MRVRKSYKLYAALVEDAETHEAALSTIHADGLPWLLQKIVDLYLRASEYGSPEERAHARTRAGLAAAQLGLVLTRPEVRPRNFHSHN